VLEVAGGSRPAASLGGVRPGRIELHDPLPSLDRLVEEALAGERGALMVERTGVLGVEAEHAGSSRRINTVIAARGDSSRPSRSASARAAAL
jgi:hypothetical protein